MANAAHGPDSKIGKLSPEEAERISAGFRPIWELDDAPFAQGNGGLNAADIDALAAGAGVAASVRGTELQQQATFEVKPAVSPPPRVPAPDEPKVEIAIELEPPPKVIVAEARPQPLPAAQAPTVARKPHPPAGPPPSPVKMDPGASADFVPVKKSNTGLILAAVGVIAVVGGIFGIRAAMSKSSTASSVAPTTTSEPTQQETTHIPPPPPDTATVAATPQPQQTAAPVETHVAPPPPAETHEEPVVTHTAPQHVAHVASAPHATGGGHAATHHAGGHAAIVRDNPF